MAVHKTLTMLGLLGLLGGFTGCDPSADAPSTLSSPASPRITNGFLSPVCQWPATTVMLSGGSPTCTGSLVHPRFVLTAAHCLPSGLQAVGFGEDGFDPVRSTSILSCTPHPDYDEGGIDLAVCELAQPVVDVPIIPMLMGCEQDALEVGAITTIVGYGNTQSYFDGEDYVWGEGIGPKRFVEQVVHSFNDEQEEINLIGVDGAFASARHGDSGGSSYIQLDDGTWRLFGVAQSLFFPDETGATESTTGSATSATDGATTVNFVDPVGGADPQPVCGPGVSYSLIAPQMPWIEQVIQGDVTPCFGADGSWDPNYDCTPFPLEANLGGGAWAQGCVGPIGGAPQCGELLETTGADSTGADDTSGGDNSGEPPHDGTTTGRSPPPTSNTATTGAQTSAATAGGTAGTESDSSGATFSDRGCTCSSGEPGSSGTGFGLLMLGLFAIRRTRS